jgi:hypothetical protein
VLKTLPAIEINKIAPPVRFVQQLKNNILDRVSDDMWLREKVISLEYDDGFDFRQFMKER